MADKRTTEAEILAEIRDGMTIGIGGWGSRRKPMSLVRAIARSGLKDLTIVSYGGPDVGLLCAAGKVKKLVYGFVSLDSIPLEPHFRLARQSPRGAAVEVMELDEGMLQWGLYAASLRLPFLPTRAGLGSDVMRVNPAIKTVKSPYEDGEELVAVPAIELDVALIHMNRADAAGNGQFLGPDPYFDDLFAGAAKKRFMTCERLVKTEDFAKEAPVYTQRIHRAMIDGVLEAPHGAHFTACEPDYDRDEPFQREYAAAAADPEAWKAFSAKWLEFEHHDDYRSAVLSRGSGSASGPSPLHPDLARKAGQ